MFFSIEKCVIVYCTGFSVFKMNLGIFIFLSVILHIVLFASIFDIYFKSPLVHGMKDHDPKVKSPASRLVLISADGMRADKFFEMDENGKTRAPYLR